MDLKQYINGKWVNGEGEELISYNPADLSIIAKGNCASAEQVKDAINVDSPWSTYELKKRVKYLERFIEIIKYKQEILAKTISKENGKPLWESRTEVYGVINKLEVSIKAHTEFCSDKVVTTENDTTKVSHKPHGLVAVIGPFNFPAHLPSGHILPALLAGNTVIFKPSNETPLVGQLLVESLHEAEFPPGTISLVHGGASIGEALTEDKAIKGIFFTGSSKTGDLIKQASIKYPKRILALEMGGNNPLIIHSINDINPHVYNIVQSAFITSGQRCTCARRLILTKSDSNKKLLELLISSIKKLKVASWDDKPFMGPVISNNAASNILQQANNLLDLGGTNLVKLNKPYDNIGFIIPGILDVSNIKSLPDAEIFGPLLQVIWAENLDHAITIANDTEYGLSAGVFSDNKKDFNKCYQGLNAGIINWNAPITGAKGTTPFGGIGKSGNYRPSAYYAAQYCTYPVTSTLNYEPKLPSIPLWNI